MAEPLTYSGALVMRTCWCGIRHAIPEELSREADLNKGTSCYCPLGHAWVSSMHEKREAERLWEELERERRRRQSTQDLLVHEERSHAATRGHLTRSRKRAAAGLCPCCNQAFQQLARHMKTKHPDFKPNGEKT